jgi:hypothetical protein
MSELIGTQKRAHICAPCQNIPVEMFYEDESDPRHLLYSTYREFFESAKTCAVCHLWHQYMRRPWDDDGPVEVRFGYAPQMITWGVCEDISCVVRPGTSGEKKWGEPTVLEELPTGPRGIQSLRELINDCVENHAGAGCQADVRQTVHPTRLLCVRDASGEHVLRIVPGREATGRWLTLSHCWGAVARDAPWKLLKSRIHDFSISIDPLDLPRTFIDAIDICRKLGESHIWIDSLCIIQDSPEDWEREASSMAGIYAGSLCTLSSATASAQGGCVLPRPNEYTAPIEWQIVSTIDKEASPTIVLYPPPVPYWRLEEECLVNTRAWCYQEKKLSRRFVQYTRNYFVWQCGERKVSEAKTVEYVSQVTGTWSLNPGYDYVYSEILEPDESSSSDVVSQFNQWYEYVKDYTTRDITGPGDRLAAIEGLARRHKLLLPTGTRYVGGFWEPDLRRGLLWQTSDPKPRAGRKPDFPSWSWAAPNATIHYADLLEIASSEEYIRSPLEPVITIPATGENSHMPGRLPPMHVSGRLIETAPMFHEVHSVGVDPDRGLQFCDRRITFPVSLRPVLDWVDEQWDVEERLHCLVLNLNQLERDPEPTMLFPCGWILRRLSEVEAKYERIGFFMSMLYMPEEDKISPWVQFLQDYEKCKIVGFTIE